METPPTPERPNITLQIKKGSTPKTPDPTPKTPKPTPSKFEDLPKDLKNKITETKGSALQLSRGKHYDKHQQKNLGKPIQSKRLKTKLKKLEKLQKDQDEQEESEGEYEGDDDPGKTITLFTPKLRL